MTISNASPIQFWPVAQNTYNETQVCGVEPRCWCAPWQCDDTIRFQATLEEGEIYTDFGVAVIDPDGQVVFSFGFTDEGAFINFAFVPSDEDICDGEYQIVIYDADYYSLLLAPSAWTGGTPDFDSRTSDKLIVSPTIGGVGYNAYQAAVTSTTDAPTTMSVHIKVSSSFGFWSIDFAFQDSSNDPTWVAQVNGTTPVDADYDLVFTSSFGSVTDKFRITATTVTGNASVEITINPATMLNDVVIYKSDCLDIRTEQECTEVVTYSNNKNFAGMIYQGVTPTPTYDIRLPVVFFHESFPQEEEVHPKSDDTWIRLSSRMERKKLLDIGYIPYYMHQKIQLILMHDNIEIQGEQWKKRDAYNIEEGDKRYPKPKANVLLTDKNFIIRNLI